MKRYDAIFVLILLFGLAIVLMLLGGYILANILLSIILFVIIVDIIHVQKLQKSFIKSLEVKLNKIDFNPLEERIEKVEKEQKRLYSKISSFDDGLNEYKLDMEKKYRDVVRKALEVDNKLNEKFRLVGESVIKLRDEIKKG